MKVYVVTMDYENEGSYEDYNANYLEFIGVFESFDKAKSFIETRYQDDIKRAKENSRDYHEVAVTDKKDYDVEDDEDGILFRSRWVYDPHGFDIEIENLDYEIREVELQ